MSGIASAFVGREHELQVLCDLAARAAAGQAVAVVVAGEAGVGKTRLAAELAASLAAEGWLCPASHGVSLTGGEVPFGGTAELVRSLVRSAGEAEVRRLLGRVAADLAPLVPSLVRDAPRRADPSAVTMAVLVLLERIGKPVCWTLDDLQWMDGATQDLLAYLAKVATGNPLVLLGTVRTDPAASSRLPEELVELGRAGQVLTLAPLAREQVAAQARSLADRALTDQEISRICEASDGLPFFVEELVASGGRVSGTLAGVLQSSLRRVSAEARTVLAAAAVGEGLLRVSSLRSVSNVGTGFDPALAEVRERGILRTDPADGGLRFRHALLREAVEAELLAEERIQLHRAWAEYLEQALGEEPEDLTLLIELGRHRYEGGGTQAFPAVHAAARAADTAADDRVRRVWWSRALDLWPVPTDDAAVLARDRALASYLSSLWAVGDIEGVEALIDQELAGESDWTRSLWLRLHRQLARRSLQKDFGRAVPAGEVEATVDRLLGMPRDFRSTEVMALLAEDCAGDLPDAALTLSEEAHRRIETRPSRDVVAMVFNMTAYLMVRRGEPDRGNALLREFVEWTTHHDPGGLLHARLSLSSGLAIAARYGEAIRVGEENLQRIHDPELHPQLWVEQHIMLAFCHINSGDWKRAEHCLALAARSAIGGSAASARDLAATMLWARRGDLARARTHLNRIPAPTNQDIEEGVWPWEAGARAFGALEIAVAEGDPERACDAYRHMAKVVRPGEAADDLVEAYVFALRCAVQRGTDEHGLLADASEMLSRRDGSRALPVMHAEIQAHLARGADEDTADDWRSVAAHWTSIERSWDAAYVGVFEAQCALRGGDRARARDALAHAHEVATRLGAEPLRQQCEATARRGRVEGIGTVQPTAGLTPREREVLDQLARGRTNGQIAATLFISSKTVSVHVTNILAKLGAHNRTEAAALARAKGLVESQ